MAQLPNLHREFLSNAIEKLTKEPWLAGLMVGGSYVTNRLDEFSDLDLILAVEEDVRDRYVSIANSLGPLLTAFTGEHIGIPNLLLCLYGPPLLHVELTFVPIAQVGNVRSDVAVLWERDSRVSNALAARDDRQTSPDAQWIEDRFWYWAYKAAGKIERGELFEAIEYLTFFRSKVLGPLILASAGHGPYGVKRIESDAPSALEDLKATLAGHDPKECERALLATINLYRRLRASEGPNLQYRREAETLVLTFFRRQKPSQ